MTKSNAGTIGRRDLLVKTVPACAAACLGLGKVQGLAGAVAALPCQEVHKFDTKIDRQFSVRDLMRMEVRAMETIIKAMREDMGDSETIRVLNMSSKALGEQVGKRQAESVSDTTFENFVADFRQIITGNNLTGEVVEDTEEVFALRITECIWPEVLGEVGLDGEIGHATVCNMDYSWPPAFNPAFKMERSKTLMQGHDCCNHRYINTAAE
jgi:hypothetical protein